jgi:hypothetical protein
MKVDRPDDLTQRYQDFLRALRIGLCLGRFWALAEILVTANKLRMDRDTLNSNI